MKVYHASSIVVENPDTIHSREYLDFGRGFYITTLREQAEKYALRFLRRGESAVLNIYELSDDLNKWKLLRFDSYNNEWLDYVAKCRSGEPVEFYDMIIGGIANDRVILTLDRYFEGELSKEQALGLLMYEKPNIQFCIRSQQMLDECLKYRECKIMTEVSKQIYKGIKCANVIAALSQMYNITIEEATDIYYNSSIADLIEEGIADLHCRSDKYLATEIWDDYINQKQKQEL